MGILNNFAQDLAQGIVNILGTFIKVMLQWLQKQITNTPYPGDSAGSPRLFGSPPPGDEFFAVYEAYSAVGGIQNTAILLWVFAVFLVFLGGTVTPLFSPQNMDTERAKKKLFVSLLGILFWWPIAVFFLAFADTIAEFLYGQALSVAGGDVSVDSGIFVGIYEYVTTQLTATNSNYGAAFAVVAALVFLLEALLYLIVGLLWYIRYFYIFILTPLMPLVIAVWAIDFPGIQILSKYAGKVPKQWLTLVFLTIPAAILTTFSTAVLSILTSQLAATSDSGGSTTQNSIASSSVSSTPSVNFNPQAPVASLQQIPEASTGSGELLAQQSGLISSVGTSVETAVLYLIITLLGLSIPLMIMATPWLLLTFTSQTLMMGVGAIANPAGAAAGALGSIGDFTNQITGDDPKFKGEEKSFVKQMREKEKEMERNDLSRSDLTDSERTVLDKGKSALEKAEERGKSNRFKEMQSRIERYGASGAGVGAFASDSAALGRATGSATVSAGRRTGSAATTTGKITSDTVENPKAMFESVKSTLNTTAREKTGQAVSPVAGLFGKNKRRITNNTRNAVNRLRQRRAISKLKTAGDIKAEYGRVQSEETSIQNQIMSSYLNKDIDEFDSPLTSRQERFAKGHGYEVKESGEFSEYILENKELRESINPAALQSEESFENIRSLLDSDEEDIDEIIEDLFDEDMKIIVDDPIDNNVIVDVTETETVDGKEVPVHEDVVTVDASKWFDSNDDFSKIQLDLNTQTEVLRNALENEDVRQKLEEETQRKIQTRLEGMGSQTEINPLIIEDPTSLEVSEDTEAMAEEIIDVSVSDLPDTSDYSDLPDNMND